MTLLIMKIFPALKKIFKKGFLLTIIIFLLGTGIGYLYFNAPGPTPAQRVESNKYSAFVSEIYDKVKQNYWDSVSDDQLLELFKLSIEKHTNKQVGEKLDSKEKMIKVLEESTSDINDEQRQKVIPTIAASVLQTLNPTGRSGLLTTKQEEQLKNTVSNINPEKDLYKDLGLNKGASETAVEKAYQQKEGELKKEDTPQAKEQLKQIAYAKDVLTQEDKKQRYDQSGVEPTIFTREASPGILYLKFQKFSPSSYDEFVKAFELYKDKPSVNTLIFDLRKNVGGAIDATPYFLGHFIGKNQYAFDFYHKGEYEPFKTPTEKLSSITKYKQVVVLVDNATQSSAEILAAAIKKYHLGVVVGVPTKGWGTVERVFPIDHQISDKEKYSMFLVHSITLREDNQPIEGRGVEPDVNINNADWEQQLFAYFRNPQLTNALKTILNDPEF